MEALAEALSEVRRLTQARKDACRVAWAVFQEADSRLADDIRGLWPNEDVAAEWICRSSAQEPSPAELVIAGRSDVVRSVIRQAEYGFCA